MSDTVFENCKFHSWPSPVPGDIALVMHATRFATVAHHGQMRKYTNEPYIVHPMTVAFMVANRTMDPHVIAAAVLHDVLEDTPATYVQLAQLFGERVAGYVVELTDFYTKENFPEFNRKQRKERERMRFAKASSEAKLIKAYDMLDNGLSIKAHDPDFAVVYLREKRALLEVIRDDLDPHVLLQLEAL